jgi:hypothetical protein
MAPQTVLMAGAVNKRINAYYLQSINLPELAVQHTGARGVNAPNPGVHYEPLSEPQYLKFIRR